MAVAVLAAFGIAVTATPVGISGAVLLLPFLFTRTHGMRTTRQMAQALGEELGH